MAGATFVRADLHVHTQADSPGAVPIPAEDIVAAAIAAGVRVLAITDHNHIDRVAELVATAEKADVLVVPGIEVSTQDGHLLALFSPDQLTELQSFAHRDHLKLEALPGGGTGEWSQRSMLDLVNEIATRGALAIPAHVDAAEGIHERMGASKIKALLASKSLAALEFTRRESLETWFSRDDPDLTRRDAWIGREADPELAQRGLARVVSSDAHSLAQLGRDRGDRALTRLRLDDLNFSAVRNAILHGSRARCRPEILLPVNYPRVVACRFHGGFLDGTKIDFSNNLNCFIGGRGSGKSTALVALRAALGADTEDDADAIGRMPDKTVVTIVDATGAERTVVRRRGEPPAEESTGASVDFPLADLGQHESGRLAAGYEESPRSILAFLDGFVDLADLWERRFNLLHRLSANEQEVKRNNVSVAALRKAEAEEAKLAASLKAAEAGKVEDLAQWAELLAAHTPLLSAIGADLAEAESIGTLPAAVDIDALAGVYSVDLSKPPAKASVEGEDGLRVRLEAFDVQQRRIRKAADQALREAGKDVREALAGWSADRDVLRARLDAKEHELAEQGLKVQAGAIRRIATELQAARSRVIEQRSQRTTYLKSLKDRTELLTQLTAVEDSIYEKRRATIKRIVRSANRESVGFTIHVRFDRGGIRDDWAKWLGQAFGLRSPRVWRLAAQLTPRGFARLLWNDPNSLGAIIDVDGSPFLDATQVNSDHVRTFDNIFRLEQMYLEDRPQIEILEGTSTDRRPFNELSAGQQRSLLLSLLLCARRPEPLIVDQPEDDLDALFIAQSVVRHLEGAKERRQVIIATHSANLAVLGDAELVIPMEVGSGGASPAEPGAVDNPPTRSRVCSMLEGGENAYVRRGERYGFTVRRP